MPAGSDTGEKARLLSLENLDGRTASARRAHSLIAELTSDLGGDLSAAQTVLTRRVAAAVAIAEHLEVVWLKGGEICIAELTTLLNSISRICSQLGLQRVPRDVGSKSIEQFIAEIAVEKQAAQVAPPPPLAPISSTVRSTAPETIEPPLAPISGGLRSIPPETIAPPPPLAPVSSGTDRDPLETVPAQEMRTLFPPPPPPPVPQ
jgi:hypothetical protein